MSGRRGRGRPKATTGQESTPSAPPRNTRRTGPAPEPTPLPVRGSGTKKQAGKAAATVHEADENVHPMDVAENPPESNSDEPESSRSNSKSDDTAPSPNPSTLVIPGAQAGQTHASTPGFAVQDQGNVALGIKRKHADNAPATATDDVRAQKIRAMNQARIANQATPTSLAGTAVVQRSTAMSLNPSGNVPGTPSSTCAAQLAALGQFTPTSASSPSAVGAVSSPTSTITLELDRMPNDLFSPTAQTPSSPTGVGTISAPAASTALVTLQSPNYKPGGSTTLQSSLTSRSSAFFAWMKFRYHVGIAFELGFPKDQASTEALVAEAYSWAFMRAPVTRKLVPEFYTMLFGSVPSFRGGLKVPVQRAMKAHLGFDALGEDAAQKLAKDLKNKTKYLFSRRSIVVAVNTPPVFEDLAFAHPVIIHAIIEMLKAPSLSHHGSIFATVPSLLEGGIPFKLYAFASVLIKHQLDVYAGATKAQASFNTTEYGPLYSTHIQYATQAFTTPNAVKRLGMDVLRAEHLDKLREAFSAEVDESPDFDALL